MRRSRESGAKFDCFPFLSIMVGMIVLLLLFMLLIVATRTMEIQAAPIPELPKPQSPDGSGAQTPPSDVPRPDAGQGDLSEDEHQRLRRQIDELALRVAERRNELEKVVNVRRELEVLLQSKEDEFALAIPDEPGELRDVIIGMPDPTIMVPDANHRVTKRPRFVEITADEFIVHREKETSRYPTADFGRGSPMVKFLHEMDSKQKRNSEYILVLVHPNGTKAYEKLRKYLLENLNETISKPVPGGTLYITKSRIDIGVEPFSPEWLLINEQSPKK